MGQIRASVTTDANGWFASVSPAFLELIDRPVESLAGVSLIDLVHPLDAATARSLFSLVVGGTVASAAAPTPVRVLAANDAWRETSFSVHNAGDKRLTVNLVAAEAAAVTPAVTPIPTPSSPPAAAAAPAEAAATTAAATPFDMPRTELSIFALDSAESFVPLDPGSDGERAFAGEEVPGARALVRDSLGAGAAAIEIDADGRTTYAAGPWIELSEAGNNGAAAFEELLERTGAANAVLDVVGEVLADGSARQIEVTSLRESHWVQVLPIPSPDRSGVVNALVAVVDERAAGSRIGSAMSEPIGQPAGAAVAAPAATQPEPQPAVDPEPVAADPEAHREPEPDETASDTTAIDGISTKAEAGEPVAGELEDVDAMVEEQSGRGFFGWLVIAIGLLIAVVVISKLWPSSDGSSSAGSIDIEVVQTEAVETAPGQSWRPTGAALVGEAHGIAASADSAYLAGTNGTILKLDSQGQGLSAVSLGGDETTFVSDIAVDDSGTTWALDAGQGRLLRISPDGDVDEVATDAAPLRNARGIGIAADGTAWIASTASAQLTKIAADGATVEVIALPGRQPSDVVEAGDGTLWMIDSETLDLVHLGDDGAVLQTLPLESFVSLNSPHLAIAGNSLWVTEPELSAVFEVDMDTGEPTGERLTLSRPGDTRVNKPIGIGADNLGRLWIADSTGTATIILDQ